MDFTITQRNGTQHTVKVSDEDADLVEIKWSLAGGKGNGKYAAHQVLGKTFYLHRYVAERMGLIDLTEPPSERGAWKVSIDHINGNKLDNRRENLRLRDRSKQMHNTNDGLRSTNKTGYRGVSLIKARAHLPKPWYASAQLNRKSVGLGMYATAEEAAAARKRWDEEHGF